MTIWLWIIGLIAVGWPLLLVFIVSAHDDRVFTEQRLAVGGHMSVMQQVIKQQDALIAALWAKTYGYYPSEDDPMIYSWDKYPVEAFGVKPRWVLRGYESAGDDSLSRASDYPWRG